MYQLMADWGHPASLPSLLDMIYLPTHLLEFLTTDVAVIAHTLFMRLLTQW